MSKNFLEYRPDEITYKKPNTTVEKKETFENSDVSDPLFIDFKNHSPYKAMLIAKDQLESISKLGNEFKKQMDKEDIETYEKSVDNNDISTITSKRKENASDINKSTASEIFPFIYKIKEDLKENINSFMLETFGKELNLREAKKKTDAILKQISKNLGTINIDAIYMDTLYNYCLIDKANVIREFIFQVEFLADEEYSNEYKSDNLSKVISDSFGQLVIKNDMNAEKIEQLIFSNMYPSINNKIVKSKEETLNNLDVFKEAKNISMNLESSLKKTLNISNAEFLTAIEDYLKTNKTLEILLQDYLNTLLNKHELRKV